MTKYKVSKIKSIFKQALATGKIVYSGIKTDANTDINIRPFIRTLNDREWKEFEVKELQYRKLIASRKINRGDFTCKGNINLWVKLIKVLSGIFYKHNSFRFKRNVNEAWSLNFIKFCCRILKSFPRGSHLSNTSSIEFLKDQFEYVKNSIIPFFALKKGINVISSRVSRDKLLQLWLHRRKKAFDVIRNNGLCRVGASG